MSDKGIQELIDLAVEVVNEISTIALGLGEGTVKAHPASMPESMTGSYIALVGEDTALEIGLVSNEAGCRSLAGALMAMGTENVDLPPEDVADALGELVNMLAGGIKKRIVDGDTTMRLGLPMMVKGKVEPPEGAERGIAEVSVGPVDTLICMYRNRSHRT